MLNREELEKSLDGMIPTFFYSETDSTNKRAREYAELHKVDGAVLFVASRQSAGRGRLGRSFVSDDGGIYMSVLMPGNGESPTEITARAAVAAAKAIEKFCGLKIGIKWVNDLYINEKKLAGILTEGVFDEKGKLSYFIVGMGINVYKNANLTANIPIATTLEDALNLRVNINQLARELALAIEGIFRLTSPLEEYRKRCILIGRPVSVIGYDDSYEALCVGVDDDYSLIVRRSTDGELVRVFTGEVSVRLDVS